MDQAAGQGPGHLHYSMLVWTGSGAGCQTTGGHPNSGQPTQKPLEGSAQITALRPGPLTRQGGVVPSRPAQGSAARDWHSPKPAGGCWRGFGVPSRGSGWPRPRPPTAPGCEGRRGRTDGTRSSCGCPPVTPQDRAPRRHEGPGLPEPPSAPPRPRPLDTRKPGPPRKLARWPRWLAQA